MSDAAADTSIAQQEFDAFAALARARIYGALAPLIASPEEAVATAWEDPAAAVAELVAALQDAPFDLPETTAVTLAGLAAAARAAPAAELAADVARAHGALFEVGDRGPPLALREELAPGANAAAQEEVARFYEHFGYELGDGYAWRPDHLSPMLEFMHFLAWHEAQPPSVDDGVAEGTDGLADDLAPGLRAAQRDFAARHLVRWLPTVAAAVAAREDGSPLIAGTLALAADFIAADLDRLEARIASDSGD
ncbi:MAG: molecular chaperone TorD family protein [Gammaproteobacteria bacterium]